MLLEEKHYYKTLLQVPQRIVFPRRSVILGPNLRQCFPEDASSQVSIKIVFLWTSAIVCASMIMLSLVALLIALRQIALKLLLNAKNKLLKVVSNILRMEWSENVIVFHSIVWSFDEGVERDLTLLFKSLNEN